MNIRIQKIDADAPLLPKLSPFRLDVFNLGTRNRLWSKFSVEPRRRFVDIDDFVRIPASPIPFNNNGNTFLNYFHYIRCHLLYWRISFIKRQLFGEICLLFCSLWVTSFSCPVLVVVSRTMFLPPDAPVCHIKTVLDHISRYGPMPSRGRALLPKHTEKLHETAQFLLKRYIRKDHQSRRNRKFCPLTIVITRLIVIREIVIMRTHCSINGLGRIRTRNRNIEWYFPGWKIRASFYVWPIHIILKNRFS